jgi:hypothetical protein
MKRSLELELERTRKLMFNWLTSRAITHLLLIETETVESVRLLVDNAVELCREFCEITCQPRLPEHKYTVVLVFPDSRADLAVLANSMESALARWGGRLVTNAVRESDMHLVRGKAGLLACSLWMLAGALLVNDAPVSPEHAWDILSLINGPPEVALIGSGRHAAIIGAQELVGPTLIRLPENHTLSDLISALEAYARSLAPARKRRPGWWPFGR